MIRRMSNNNALDNVSGGMDPEKRSRSNKYNTTQGERYGNIPIPIQLVPMIPDTLDVLENSYGHLVVKDGIVFFDKETIDKLKRSDIDSLEQQLTLSNLTLANPTSEYSLTPLQSQAKLVDTANGTVTYSYK